MRALTLCFTLLSLLAAQQTSRQTSIYTLDGHGRRVEGSTQSEIKDAGSYQRTTRTRSINGRIVPQETVQERVVYQDARQTVKERTRQLYDYDGRPLPLEQVRVVAHKNPDGTETVVTTSYEQDLNGRFQLRERSTSQVTTSATGRSEATVVERPNLSGSMDVVERINRVETKIGTREQHDTVTYRKGINGDFYEASREVTQRVEEPGLVTEDKTSYERVAGGPMQPVTRTVSRTRALAGNREVEESTIYRAWTAGRSDAAAGLRASEQLLVERTPGPGNTITETTSVRTPSLDPPYSFGNYQKLSEVTCAGQCKPEKR